MHPEAQQCAHAASHQRLCQHIELWSFQDICTISSCSPFAPLPSRRSQGKTNINVFSVFARIHESSQENSILSDWEDCCKATKTALMRDLQTQEYKDGLPRGSALALRGHTSPILPSRHSPHCVMNSVHIIPITDLGAWRR